MLVRSPVSTYCRLLFWFDFTLTKFSCVCFLDREAYKLEQLQDKLEELEGRWMSEMTKFRAYQRRIDHKNSEYATLLKEEARMTAGAKQIQDDTERVLVDIEFLEKKEQMLINKVIFSNVFSLKPQDYLVQNSI